jgi:hypothetical protein
MPNVLMIPTSNAPLTLTCYGRTYAAVPGAAPLSVPDGDQSILSANGWIQIGTAGSGTTSQRPAAAGVGATFFDSTLNILVVAVGKGRWARHDSGAIV